MKLLLYYKDNDDKQLLGKESSQFSIFVSIPHDITNLEESLLAAVLQSIWALISMEIAD